LYDKKLEHQRSNTGTYCAFGTYTSNEGETQCHDCPANFYNPYLGASSCLECPYGKTSGATSASCSSCEFTYMLSRNCDVPIMGVLIGVASVLFFLLLSWYDIVQFYLCEKSLTKHSRTPTGTCIESTRSVDVLHRRREETRSWRR